MIQTPSHSLIRVHLSPQPPSYLHIPPLTQYPVLYSHTLSLMTARAPYRMSSLEMSSTINLLGQAAVTRTKIISRQHKVGGRLRIEQRTTILKPSLAPMEAANKAAQTTSFS